MNKMNKKGAEAHRYLFFTIIVMTLIGSVLGLIVVFEASSKMDKISEGIPQKVYETRVLYSPHCLAYQDPETKRVYSGVIDSNKYVDEVLQNCLPLNALSQDAVLVELSFGDNNKVLKTRNWDKKIKTAITTKSYLVEIKNEGPGLITFHHKR